ATASAWTARLRRTATGPSVGVFTVSANTPEALRRNLAVQADAVARRPRGDAATLCWNSNLVKTGLPYRAAFTARDTTELAAVLRAAADDERLRAGIADRAVHPPTIGFLFSGQGIQEPGMTSGLYRDCASYRHHLDSADEALAAHLHGSVRDLILAEDPAVHRTGWAQPALFAVGYALFRTLGDLGIEPDAVLGHSVGEFAAAVAAGALRMEDAARLVARRAALMDALPDGGGMLAVHAGPDDLVEPLADEPHVTVAAVNGPADTVLSGGTDGLDRIAAHLREQGVRTRRLRVSHAFHSPLMAPALDRFAEEAAGIDAGTPRIPMASTRYGHMLGDRPLDAGYWKEQAARPVLFAEALDDLMAETMPACLVEIGPGPQLVQLAERAGLPTGVRLLLPVPGREATARDFAETVATLYRAGAEPRWQALYEPARRTAEHLAPYAFATEHAFWQPAPRTPDQHPDRTPEATGIPAGAPAEVPDEAPAGEAGENDPVLGAVIEAIVEVGEYPPERVGRQTRLHADLGFDSVMIMQLKDRIEHRLPRTEGVTVQQLLPALRSVGSLADFLSDWISVGART
ncbi:acyltransferase domain-containing protein, partial [Streptomyces sp. sk2.1]|uniref:acyltransferase domain-containing protein n=1 Tax=Streptomyces sp. sk2.1 TaxID=2478959 RepID=UPI0011E7FC3D